MAQDLGPSVLFLVVTLGVFVVAFGVRFVLVRLFSARTDLSTEDANAYAGIVTFLILMAGAALGSWLLFR